MKYNYLKLFVFISLFTLFAQGCNNISELQLEQKEDFRNMVEKLKGNITVYPLADITNNEVRGISKQVSAKDGSKVWIYSNWIIDSCRIQCLELIPTEKNSYALRLKLNDLGKKWWPSLMNGPHKQYAFLIDGICYEVLSNSAFQEIDGDGIVNGNFDKQTAIILQANANKNYKFWHPESDKE